MSLLDDADVELAEADLEADEVGVELDGAVVVPPLRLLSFSARTSFTAPVIFDTSACTCLRSSAWPLWELMLLSPDGFGSKRQDSKKLSF